MLEDGVLGCAWGAELCCALSRPEQSGALSLMHPSGLVVCRHALLMLGDVWAQRARHALPRLNQECLPGSKPAPACSSAAYLWLSECIWHISTSLSTLVKADTPPPLPTAPPGTTSFTSCSQRTAPARCCPACSGCCSGRASAARRRAAALAATSWRPTHTPAPRGTLRWPSRVASASESLALQLRPLAAVGRGSDVRWTDG